MCRRTRDVYTNNKTMPDQQSPCSPRICIAARPTTSENNRGARHHAAWLFPLRTPFLPSGGSKCGRDTTLMEARDTHTATWASLQHTDTTTAGDHRQEEKHPTRATQVACAERPRTTSLEREAVVAAGPRRAGEDHGGRFQAKPSSLQQPTGGFI
jgi:hypothetical protein